MTLTVAQRGPRDAGAGEGHAGWHRGHGGTSCASRHRPSSRGSSSGSRARSAAPSWWRRCSSGRAWAASTTTPSRARPTRVSSWRLTFMFTLVYVDRAADPRGPLRVPRPAGAVRRWPGADCLGAAALGRGAALGVSHGGDPGRAGRSSSCSPIPLTSDRPAGATRPCGPTTPRRRRPRGPTCSAATGRSTGSWRRPSRRRSARPAPPSCAPTRCPSTTARTSRRPSCRSAWDRSSYSGRPPSYSVVLVRPDGQEVTLYRDVVRGPRPGEQPPYVRNADAPDAGAPERRVRRGGGSRQVLAKAYGVTVDGRGPGRPSGAGVVRRPGRGGWLHAAAWRLPGRGARRGGRSHRHGRRRRGSWSAAASTA